MWLSILNALALSPGLFAFLLGEPSPHVFRPAGLDSLALNPEWRSPWLPGLARDTQVEGLLANYLTKLGQKGLTVEDQGIWITAQGSVVAEHGGATPLPAASLTKLATTLAAVGTWPLDHRFETLVGITGPLENGVVYGDLVVKGSGDPLFVWEEGIVLANHLQSLGIQRVTGDLLVLGPFTMNFEEDPQDSLTALKLVMAAPTWPRDAWQAYGQLDPSTAQPDLVIAGSVRPITSLAPNSTANWLVRHQSLPLVGILKAMNIYSNNIMAEMVADLVGGTTDVVAKATTLAALPSGELSLVNGSGLGMENKMSARTVVALMATLQHQLGQQGYSISDVLPVAGQDIGTLVDRRLPATAAVKTGSLAQVSALAGVVPTATQGPVWFAILNRGWNISDLRTQQDNLVLAIQDHWGAAQVTTDLTPKVRMQEGNFRYGDPRRNLTP
ncbi:MAG: D-alanyl-D-alanine carboxypeptidase [Nodosilinea sp.]